MDEAIATVVTVTGSTPELAAQYVQLADGDANQAVQLYFENGGADLAAGSSTTTARPPPSPSTSRPLGNALNPIDVDADDNISDNDPEITGYGKVSRGQGPSRPSARTDIEDDEAMARRLQEEMYGESDLVDDIRAPIARQSETLVGPGIGSELDVSVHERMQAMQRRRGQGEMNHDGCFVDDDLSNPCPGYRPSIFNQHQPASNIWQSDGGGMDYSSLSEATGGASEQSSRSNMLARLFQPPWELMYKGSWEDAREEGKEHKKWLLVSIQDGSVFDCQALNRDLWKNEGIVETIKENFIFLQYSKDDPRSEQYTQYYFPGWENPEEYPHVAIVDPRTGEQIKLWSRKVPSAAEFLMQLHEFLDRYSLDNHVRNPVAKRKPEAKKEKPIEQMSEEEMMEKALQASLATQTQEREPPPAEDPDELTRSVGDLGGAEFAAAGADGDAMSLDEEGHADLKASPFALIPSNRPHLEPESGPGITRIQIRHPGGRIVRRFAQDDPVQRIYEYLKAEPLEGKEGVEFELVSLGKNLMDLRHETIENAGLKNGTVMVEFVED